MYTTSELQLLNNYSGFVMVMSRGKDLCILWLYLNMNSYLLKLPEVCQKEQKETDAH